MMTDPELEWALRALTEVEASPALASRVLAAVGTPEHATRPGRWLAAAVAVLVIAFCGIEWHRGRPTQMPRVPSTARLAVETPLSVPHVPPAVVEPSLRVDPTGASSPFARRHAEPGDARWPHRLPAIDRSPPLAIDSIRDAPLRDAQLVIAPL